MREIKLKVWDKVNKCWLKDLSWETTPASAREGQGLLEMFSNEFFEWVQFTGLLDKNGKEIYEGDIVKSTPPNIDFHSKPVEVKWSEITAGWLFGKTSLPHTDLEFVEIIGNRFENPELLK